MTLRVYTVTHGDTVYYDQASCKVCLFCLTMLKTGKYIVCLDVGGFERAYLLKVFVFVESDSV